MVYSFGSEAPVRRNNSKVWLARQPNIKTLFIGHRNAIQDPSGVADRLNAFLGGDLDVAAMASIVDSSLYRQRAVAVAVDRLF